MIEPATPDDRVPIRRVLDGVSLTVTDLEQSLMDGRVLVARPEKTIVGAVVVAEPPDSVVQVIPESVNPAAGIEAIGVLGGRRGSGIGSALVRAALERWEPLVVDCRPAVAPFWESVGFQTTETPAGRVVGWRPTEMSNGT